MRAIGCLTYIDLRRTTCVKWPKGEKLTSLTQSVTRYNCRSYVEGWRLVDSKSVAKQVAEVMLHVFFGRQLEEICRRK